MNVFRPAKGLVAVILLGLLVLLPFRAAAQENFSDQIKRMQRDLEDIQSFLYRSTDIPSSKGVTTAPAGPNPESMALLQRQALEMQTQMRDLTGQLEQFEHGIRVMGTRLDKLVGDVDLRLQALEARGAPVAAQPFENTPIVPGRAVRPPQTVVSRDNKGTTIISSRTYPGGTAIPAGSNSLGTVQQRNVDAIIPGQPQPVTAAAPIPANRNAPPPRATPAPGPAGVTASGVQQMASTPNILPDGTVQEQYTFAFKLLRKRDYDTAELALREFIERHPDVPLAGNAMYWMGETFYVRKEYAEAARIFLDAYQRFPKGNKAADNLFKLAKSLAQIGENETACTTYDKLLKSMPAANSRLLANARNDMGRLKCS